jgi:hypothetical protein
MAGKSPPVSPGGGAFEYSHTNAPMYEQFKQSDFYKDIANKAGAMVVGSSTIDGKSYSFPMAMEAEAYSNYMRSLGNYNVGGRDTREVPTSLQPTTPNQGTNNMAATDTSLKGKTGEELEAAVLQRQTEQADATAMSQPTAVTPIPQGVQQEELLTTTGKETTTPTIAAPQEVDAEAFATQAPTPAPAATYTATDAAPKLGEVEVTTGALSRGSIMEAAQGTASPESLATAAVQELDPRGTTRYQIAELFKTIEDGKPLPAWAAPAVRAVTAEMQKRGLGASSMAAAATVQAVMESGIPIAAQDAQKYATLQLQNLNNEQQAALQNATVLAAMDTANLNNRQQAQVANAKAFLTVDLQNMTNDQAAKTLTYKSKTTAMLSDAAATNAANQFNARTSNEVDLFFAELATNIEAASKNRVASIKQQNIAQKTAVEQFNAQMVANRDQFNSNMRMQIDQSNAVWRRNINTANTAAQNSANRENALNLLNINQASLNNLWQTYRDNAAWAMQISENTRERAHNAAMQSESIAYNSDSYDDKFNDYLILETIDNLFT